MNGDNELLDKDFSQTEDEPKEDLKTKKYSTIYNLLDDYHRDASIYCTTTFCVYTTRSSLRLGTNSTEYTPAGSEETSICC